MDEAYLKISVYFNSGYCKFTNKKNGCRYIHPEKVWNIIRCKDKDCPFRHPKMCKHFEHCRYRKNCVYWHEIETHSNIVQVNANSMRETRYLLTKILTLKAEIVKI